MVEEHVKQLSPNHGCKIGLSNNREQNGRRIFQLKEPLKNAKTCCSHYPYLHHISKKNKYLVRHSL
jgi:hypothetical protein